MKKYLFSALAAIALCVPALAQDWHYVDAASLTMVGKLFPDTPNPYHRIDTEVYGGFDKVEFKQVKMSAGIAIAFRTDSPAIKIKADHASASPAGSTPPVAQRGYDLYMKSGKSWKWAGCTTGEKDKEKALLYFCDPDMHECLLYLPLFCELNSLQIGVKEGCTLEPIDNPFRHRIAVFGSSYTHGYGCSRSGMTWSAQLSRMTGLQFLNLGCSGHSTLQKYFAEALAEAPVEAYLFDGFSNPKANMIEERLFEFIETIQAKNPGKPLVFLKTIRRSWRNFNNDVDRKEVQKADMADLMMKKAVKKYKDVYYVTTTNASSPDFDTTTDGTHPDNYGYRLWAESVEKPVVEILAKYGIK